MCASLSTSARSSTSGSTRLPGTARPVVLLAAALQDGFAVSDLAVVAGVEEASAEAAVGAALRRGVLERDASGLRFRHPLLRDAARRQLDPERLIDAHLRAAARLRESGGAPERVGYHLLAAGRGGEAVPLLTAAARRAAARRRIPRRPAVGGAGPGARARRGPG